MIPIEIINKILVYVAEINHNIMITQYHPTTHTESYKINFNSDLLWKLKSTILMKHIYPIRSGDFSNLATRELYKFGIPHYENQLRKRVFPRIIM
jgi:hypothetical protein